METALTHFPLSLPRPKHWEANFHTLGRSVRSWAVRVARSRLQPTASRSRRLRRLVRTPFSAITLARPETSLRLQPRHSSAPAPAVKSSLSQTASQRGLLPPPTQTAPASRPCLQQDSSPSPTRVSSLSSSSVVVPHRRVPSLSQRHQTLQPASRLVSTSRTLLAHSHSRRRSLEL